MKYFSTRDSSKEHACTLREAALLGLANDGGLYLPEYIPALDKGLVGKLKGLPFHEIACQLTLPFMDPDVTEGDLNTILNKHLPFTPRLEEITNNIYALELFHGPTLAFKDFGASFMAGLFELFKQKVDDQTTTVILAATSGDTGSAVGQAFKDIPGFRVVLLYPAGKVSAIQEAQLTTIGGNVSALKINGSFDDCQCLVKQAFADENLRSQICLSSANSINITRLIPQMIYYAWTWANIPNPELPLIYSVPSGNFGNLTAGILAQRMGIPITHFVAATNLNDPVPQYLSSGSFNAKPSIPTMSNAMDVGNPSNFERMLALFSGDHKAMCSSISGYSIDETETIKAMQTLYSFGYTSDPHAAVGYAGLNRFLESRQIRPSVGVFLATAHPAKFPESVQMSLGSLPNVPEELRHCLETPPQFLELDAVYDSLRHHLLSHY